MPTFSSVRPSLLAMVLIASFAPAAAAQLGGPVVLPTNQLPIGSFDAIDLLSATGWAQDPDRPARPIDVHLYRDGTATTGVFGGAQTADLPVPGIGDHGFAIQLPSSFQDGWSHAAYAYAINVPSGPNPLLDPSPRILRGERTEVWMTAGEPWSWIDSHQWEFVKQNVDVLQLYIDKVNAASLYDLRKLVVELEKNDIKISIECGGLLSWFASPPGTTGINSSNQEINKLAVLTAPVASGGAGGTVSYLNFDGPIRRCLYNSQTGTELFVHTPQSAADQLVVAMNNWRSVLPNVQFMLLTNFPNWGWNGGPAYHDFGYTPGPQGYGDYASVVQTVFSTVAAAGLSLRGVTVDNPYDYAIGAFPSNQPTVTAGVDWFQRIRELEDWTEAQGGLVHIIFNTHRGSNAATGSDQLFQQDTLAYIDDYHARGGTPAIYGVQSWETYPVTFVPETQTFTLTDTVAKVIDEAKPTSALQPPLAIDHQFDVDGDSEGWVSWHGLSPVTVAAGSLSATVTGSDPQLFGPVVSFAGDDVDIVRIRMKTTAGTTGQLFWANEDGFFSQARSVTFPLTNGDFQVYDLDLSHHPEWQGKQIERLRLDPTEAATGSVDVDYIQNAHLPAPTTAPLAPTNLTGLTVYAAPQGGPPLPVEVILSWQNTADDEVGLRIERRVNGGTWTLVQNLPADSTSWTDHDITAGTTYSWRIQTYNYAGNSPWTTW